MDAPLRLRTTVLPGHRLEIVDTHLPDGGEVDVIVLVPSANEATTLAELGPARAGRSIRELFGTWTMVEAKGLDNEQLDAELLRAYEDTHEEGG